jgi:hypothetical protein
VSRAKPPWVASARNLRQFAVLASTFGGFTAFFKTDGAVKAKAVQCDNAALTFDVMAITAGCVSLRSGVIA